MKQSAKRLDFADFRVPCANCGKHLPPSKARWLQEVGKEQPFGVLVDCGRCGTENFVVFRDELGSGGA